jgi:hypothetical protein
VPSLNGEAHFITGTADPAADQDAIGDMYINNTTGPFMTATKRL